jgi:glycosyltransferase involved in cell wall biosynthesis
MRIGLDARLPTYQMGGISQYILNLLPALAEQDPANDYLVLHSRKERRDFRPTGASRFKRASLWTPCHHPLERWTLGLELAPRRLDLLHSPDFIPPAFGPRRRVITVHDLSFLYYPEFLTAASRRYYADQIGWAVRAADMVIADSDHTRQDIIKRLEVAPAKVTTVHLAAGPAYTEPMDQSEVAATLARLGLPSGFVLFAGTLEPRKNIPILLRALRHLADNSGVDPLLVLAGRKGWLYRPILELVSELGLVERVRHLDGLTDRELAALYRGAAALAFPSFYEGFGLPPLEAMHAGCPVICSRRASLPEVVGPAAIMLEPEDVAAWSDALYRLLTDTALAERLRQAGYEQAARFTWPRTAAATLAVYRRALES